MNHFDYWQTLAPKEQVQTLRAALGVVWHQLHAEGRAEARVMRGAWDSSELIGAAYIELPKAREDPERDFFPLVCKAAGAAIRATYRAEGRHSYPGELDPQPRQAGPEERAILREAIAAAVERFRLSPLDLALLEASAAGTKKKVIAAAAGASYSYVAHRVNELKRAIQ